MKAHDAKVKVKSTTNEIDVGRKEVYEVLEVYEVYEVRNFRLPMLVLSPIIKVISFQRQTPNTKRQTINNKS